MCFRKKKKKHVFSVLHLSVSRLNVIAVLFINRFGTKFTSVKNGNHRSSENPEKSMVEMNIAFYAFDQFQLPDGCRSKTIKVS